MDADRFDQLAKAFRAVGSRRWVIGGLLAGAHTVSRSRRAAANHKAGHQCTPSDNHACPEGQTCRRVNDAWTCVFDDPCRNGVQDGNETDVDCGGPNCPGCDPGLSCLVNDDCDSGFCFVPAGLPAGFCQPACGQRNDVCKADAATPCCDNNRVCSLATGSLEFPICCIPGGRSCTNSFDCCSGICVPGTFCTDF